jgi:hypothetical protein
MRRFESGFHERSIFVRQARFHNTTLGDLDHRCTVVYCAFEIVKPAVAKGMSGAPARALCYFLPGLFPLARRFTTA